MEFVEAPAFTRWLPAYLTDEEYRRLQAFLAASPEAGDAGVGTGGFRKLRWRDPRRGKGKRGGLRVVYYHLASDSVIWLMTLYGKDEAEDLSAEEEKLLKAALAQELGRRSLRRRD